MFFSVCFFFCRTVQFLVCFSICLFVCFFNIDFEETKDESFLIYHVSPLVRLHTLYVFHFFQTCDTLDCSLLLRADLGYHHQDRGLWREGVVG